MTETTSTYSKDAPCVITLEKLKAMYETLPETKRIVILFTPFLESMILYGEWIDKMLGLEEDEEGFFVPEKYRPSLHEYVTIFKEWRWRPPKEWMYGTFR
jgi:hypothetical protein